MPGVQKPHCEPWNAAIRSARSARQVWLPPFDLDLIYAFTKADSLFQILDVALVVLVAGYVRVQSNKQKPKGAPLI